MHWQFHYPKRIAFWPPDYESPGLGGIEVALVLLTRALAARGHRVEVFACCWRPGVFDNVTWRLAAELESADSPDVAVAVRFEEALWPTRGGHSVFWMLDDRTGGAVEFLKRRPACATIIVSSEAQRRRLDAVGIASSVEKIPLPIETSRYRMHPYRSLACLFCSMPNRGLNVALRIWPSIEQLVPGAELWVTSGWKLWGYTHSEDADRWKQILTGIDPPKSVKVFRTVRRSELIRLQESAALCLYPCRFPEMFCLSVAECAAAGTPAITSALEALTERVSHENSGELVQGSIDELATQQEFLWRTVALLRDRSRRDAYGTAAREAVLRCDVVAVAMAWEAVASGRLCSESE